MSIKNMIVAAGLAALGFAGVSGAQVLGGFIKKKNTTGSGKETIPILLFQQS